MTLKARQLLGAPELLELVAQDVWLVGHLITHFPGHNLATQEALSEHNQIYFFDDVEIKVGLKFEKSRLVYESAS